MSKTKSEIIEELYRKGTLKTLIENCAKTSIDSSPNLQDLEQDLYVSLLMKEDDKIIEMYEKHQLTFFLVRMINNNINSVNSPYYTQYRKFSLLSEPEPKEPDDED